jgi:hypothetical protein
LSQPRRDVDGRIADVIRPSLEPQPLRAALAKDSMLRRKIPEMSGLDMSRFREPATRIHVLKKKE